MMARSSTTQALGEDLGKLLLRSTVGGLMLFHGIGKVLHGIDGITGLLTSKGLPEAMAYGVYVGEVVAPLLIIFGLFTRLSAAILAFNMVVATLLAHSGDLLSLDNHGGWAIEVQMFYLLAAVAIVLLGAGHFSIDAVWANQRAASGASEG